MFVKQQTDSAFSGQRRDRFGDPVEDARKRRGSRFFGLALPSFIPSSWHAQRLVHTIPSKSDEGAVPVGEVIQDAIKSGAA